MTVQQVDTKTDTLEETVTDKFHSVPRGTYTEHPSVSGLTSVVSSFRRLSGPARSSRKNVESRGCGCSAGAVTARPRLAPGGLSLWGK